MRMIQTPDIRYIRRIRCIDTDPTILLWHILRPRDMRPFSPARTTLAPSTFQSRYYQAGDEDERGPDTGPVSGDIQTSWWQSCIMLSYCRITGAQLQLMVIPIKVSTKFCKLGLTIWNWDKILTDWQIIGKQKSLKPSVNGVKCSNFMWRHCV